MSRSVVAFTLAATLFCGCRATIELDPGGMDVAVCHPVGSACAVGNDCCSGVCDGFCVAVDGCRPAGESCAAGADCCSHVCAGDGSGRVICQRIGGCRVVGELCSADRDCCPDATCAGIDAETGIGRCARAGTCVGAGEICRVNGDPAAMRDCCDSTAGRIQCRASDVRGLDRCLVTSSECAGNGGACAAPGDCCGGRCVPDADGRLSCSSACVGGVGRCTSDADCCGATCALDAHCAAVRTCAAIAEPCDADADCCSGLCDDAACGSPLF